MSVPLAPTRSDAEPVTPWLRRLCLAVIALSVVVFGIATIGVQIQQLPPRTDFASYYLAGVLARAHHSPYDTLAFDAAARRAGYTVEPFPFLYPPPFALAMQPLARLSYPHARQVWMAMATLALFAALAMTAACARRQAELIGLRSRYLLWPLLAAFVAAALDSTGVHNDIRSGSVGIGLWLMLVVASWAAMQRRSALLGVALATAAIAKLSPVILIPWVAWRGERRAAGLATALVALAMLAACVHWGWGIAGDWIQHAIGPKLQAPNGWSHNQSLDAYLVRLFDPRAIDALPRQASRLQIVLSMVLSLGLGVATLRTLAVRSRPAAFLPVEVAFASLAVLVLMKITWVHTLAAVLFAWPVVMVPILRAAERGAAWAKRAGLTACAGFFLSAAHLPILWNPRLDHYPWIVFTGAHLFGLLLLWGTCGYVLRHAAELEQN